MRRRQLAAILRRHRQRNILRYLNPISYSRRSLGWRLIGGVVCFVGLSNHQGHLRTHRSSFVELSQLYHIGGCFATRDSNRPPPPQSPPPSTHQLIHQLVNLPVRGLDLTLMQLMVGGDGSGRRIARFRLTAQADDVRHLGSAALFGSRITFGHPTITFGSRQRMCASRMFPAIHSPMSSKRVRALSASSSLKDFNEFKPVFAGSRRIS